MKFVIYVIIFFYVMLTNVYAISEVSEIVAAKDSLHSDTATVMPSCPLIKESWFTIPMGYYQQETSVALGIVGGYYFPSTNLRKISSISGSVIYTFRNQFIINANPRFYGGDGNWFFNGNVNLRYYPTYYYGIGNSNSIYNESYISKSLQLMLQSGYFINDNWQIGPYVSLRGEKITVGESFENHKEAIFARYGSAGWNPYWMTGLGFFSTYDTRDNVFYPQKTSVFIKTSVLNYFSILGSTFDVASFNGDFRCFLPTWFGQLIACQLYLDARLGGNIPFQLLPTVGGSDNLRGFRERKYIDDMFVQLQTEYRIPIWNRLKATLFYSVGDVVSTDNPSFRLKMAYGGGLRFRLNDARVHLRADIARTNYGNVEFYITATEAF